MQKYLAILCLSASLTQASEDSQQLSAQEAPSKQHLHELKDDSQAELTRLKEENETLKSNVQDLLTIFKQCSLGDLEEAFGITYRSKERVRDHWEEFSKEIYECGHGTSGIYHMDVSRRDNFRWSVAWVPSVPKEDIYFSNSRCFFAGFDSKLPEGYQLAVRLSKSGGAGPFGYLIDPVKTSEGKTAQQIREITSKLQSLSAKE